ncbi:MAG: hypothetical protein ACRDZO_17200 [Egibacteraceae bacterium]
MSVQRPTTRQPRWRAMALALVGMLVFGLTSTGTSADAVSDQASPAARAVAELTSAQAGQGLLAVLPGDFTAVMGYRPVIARLPGGVRAVKPSGDCSAWWGGGPFGFDAACKAHDLGYDLLRFAAAEGRPLAREARSELDAMFERDLHAQCRMTREGVATAACHASPRCTLKRPHSTPGGSGTAHRYLSQCSRGRWASRWLSPPPCCSARRGAECGPQRSSVYAGLLRTPPGALALTFRFPPYPRESCKSKPARWAEDVTATWTCSGSWPSPPSCMAIG